MAFSARRKLDSAVYDLDVTKQVVENAEGRALLHTKANSSKLLRGNNRQYAQALHRQADELYQRGEYESALVLYHRAATLCSHESSHSVAARRTAAMISSWDNPEKTSVRLSANMRDDTISRAISCPESAAFRGRDVLQSSDLSIIPDILRYLLIDNKKDLTRTTSTLAALDTQSIQTRTILKNVNSHANATLRKLKASYNAGRVKSSLRLAEQLLKLSSNLGDPRQYQILAYHYLSLIYVALGRHDRACSNVAKMVHLSKNANNAVLLLHSLVTLGKVHLSFGHLEAASRAWENLSIHVDKPVLRAWIHHEIGRCHLETGKYVEALRKAVQCQENAIEANSKKWIFHGGLLKAQCLAMLGRFAEALDELRVSAKISEEEGDTPTLSYIRDLIDQLNRALREVTFSEDQFLKSTLQRLSPRGDLQRSQTNEAITTCGIRSPTRRKGDSLTLPLHPNYLQNVRTPDQNEIDEESNSLDSAMSYRSKSTNATYVIKSHTDSSNKDKIDGTKMYDEEMTELLSCESYLTFRTCRVESTHFVDAEETLTSLKPVEVCSSNVETSSRKTDMARSDVFRISKSCEDGRHILAQTQVTS